MAAYSDDDALKMIRPNICSLGQSSWDDHHDEAANIIDAILIGRWYKEVAEENGVDWRTTPFDRDKIDSNQIKRLACYKTLDLAYLYLMKDSPEPDGFEREHKLFGKLFITELETLLTLGINYDWDGDDVIADEEKYQPQIRRLVRM